MMHRTTLYFDTASHHGGIAVRNHDGMVIKRQITGGIRAESLVTEVRMLLSEAKVSLSEVSLGVVNIGPGSFTGIRSGLSFTQGLFSGLRKDAGLMYVSGLEVLRQIGPSDEDFIAEVIVIQTAKDSFTIEYAPGTGMMGYDNYSEVAGKNLLLELTTRHFRKVIIEESVAATFGLESNLFTVPSILDAMISIDHEDLAETRRDLLYFLKGNF